MTHLDAIKVTIINVNKTGQYVATSYFAKATIDDKMSQTLALSSCARNEKNTIYQVNFHINIHRCD